MHSFGGARVPTPALYRYLIVHVVDAGPVGGGGTLRHVGSTLGVGGGQLHRVGHLERPHERHRPAPLVGHGGRPGAQRTLPVHLRARILLHQTQETRVWLCPREIHRTPKMRATRRRPFGGDAILLLAPENIYTEKNTKTSTSRVVGLVVAIKMLNMV
mgnify:FL=1